MNGVPELEQFLAQLAAIRLLTTLLLADRFEAESDPVKASDAMIARVSGSLSAAAMPQDFSMHVSEAMAAIVHEATRAAMGRRGGQSL
jgi:hypothetical protein